MRDWYKWVDRLLALTFGISVLAVVWVLLQVTCFTSFRVPSPSMYPTLIPGDYILVNKWLMGARIFDIVGVATRVWKSVSPQDGEVRWNRIMKKIE
jgi:signal peptidase I